MRKTSPWDLACMALVVLAPLACGGSPTRPSPQACAYTLSNSSLTVGAAGGTASVTVTAGANCAWTAASDQGWIAITGGASGSGNGTVIVNLSANPGGTPRTGALTIAAKSVAVTQEGLGPCNIDISPTAASYSKDSSNGTFAVTAASHCQWTAVSSAGWLAITSGGSGTGNGTVAYSVATNRDVAPRTATITVGARSLTVNQAGDTPGCQYSLSPTSLSFGSQGGSASVGVSTASECAWNAVSDRDWVTITGGASGSGGGTVQISVASNPTQSARTAIVTIAGIAVSVHQDAAAQNCEYSVSPVEFTPCMSVPFNLTATVTTQQGCTWTATAVAPWITLTGGHSGSGSNVITFRVSDNFEAPRQSVIEVRWPTATVGQNLQVKQAGCFYAVTTSAINIGVGGGTGNFGVFQIAEPNTCGGALQNACRWTAEADVPWITITTSMPQAGDNPVSFTVAPNGTGAVRTGRITVRDKVVVITQAGS